MSLTGPYVELSSEGPVTRDVAGSDAEYCRHPDASPLPHIPNVATFDFAAGQGVSLSVEITAVTIGEGNPVKTLLCGEYFVKYHIPVDRTASGTQASCRFCHIRDQS
jgi:hypothetical protein